MIAVQFSSPPILRPRAALLSALLLYGAMGAWLGIVCRNSPGLMVPGIFITCGLGCFYLWMTGFVFPRLKEQAPATGKWRYRGMMVVAVLGWVTLSAVMETAWHFYTETQIPRQTPPLVTLADGRIPAEWIAASAQAGADKKRKLKAIDRPVAAGAWLTFSLLLRWPGLYSRPAKSLSRIVPKPPPLPIAKA